MMKKNFVRIVAALLVAMLALTLIPLGALAVEADDSAVSGGAFIIPSLFGGAGAFTDKNPAYPDPPLRLLGDAYPLMPGDKLEVDDWETLVGIDGDPYEFKGFFFPNKPIFNAYQDHQDWIADHPDATDEEIQAVLDKLLDKYVNQSIHFHESDLKIPAFPTDPEAQEEWISKYSYILAGYVPHTHKLSRWYSDSTTHWRECLICKHYDEFDEDFMLQSWHVDGDEDRICDVCNADIPYHEVRVIETEGGTITVNETEAPHRRKIIATVEAAEGYTFQKLHFTKVRDDGSRQEITRYKNADGYWTYMPTYDLEVSAEFVKK